MPAQTTRLIQYPIPGDNQKDAGFAAKLAEDMKVLALTADTAIGVEGARAEAAASWYKGGVTAETVLADLPNGAYHVSSGAIATALGLPVPQPGTLEIIQFGTLGIRNFQTSEAVPATYGQRKTSTGWQAWEDLRNSWYKGGAAVADPKLNDIDALPTGSVTVSTASVAAALGLPEAESSVVETWRFGTLDYAIQRQTTMTTPARVRTRWKTSGAFSAWSDPIGSLIPDVVGGGSGPASGMKLVPLAATLGQGTQTAPTSRTYRIPLNFNAPITRWRLHITDRNPHTGEHVGAGINITDVFIGDHAGNGDFTAAPVRIGGGILLDTLAGGEWFSAWRSEPLGAGVDRLLSYAYTSTAAPFAAVAGAFNTSAAVPGDVDFPDAAQTVYKTAAFDIWIEAETYSGTPVYAAFGDSLSSGAQATFPCLESAVSIYARAHKGLPVHYAVSGNAMQDWAEDTAAYKWIRWEHLDKADVVLWGMGHNDVYRGRTLAQMQADFNLCYPFVTARMGRAVVAATVTPRNVPADPAMHAVRNAWNAWLKEQVGAMSNGRVRDVFDFDAVIADGDTIKPAYNSGDDIHLNTAGYEAEAAAVSRPISAPPVMYATV